MLYGKDGIREIILGGNRGIHFKPNSEIKIKAQELFTKDGGYGDVFQRPFSIYEQYEKKASNFLNANA